MKPERKILARELDAMDPLGHLREDFHFPRRPDGRPVIYLCGNSLGLQPKGVRASLERELERWAEHGVEGHFQQPQSWYDFHEVFSEPMAHIVGAKPSEVVAMNSLTTNLHLLMVSFYRPTPTRYKILIEGSAFPSDQYAVASQVRYHGHDPANAVVALKPRDGEETLRDEDILAYIEAHGHEIALIMFGGVHYYTGQRLDLEAITRAGHAAGAVVGFDLAHAAGNVEIKLHDWGVDFAAWCSYKYLNAGPGAVAGCFVHERHSQRTDLPRFEGWWGTDPATRFQMGSQFVPQVGAGAWQLSNAPILSMAALRASMELFEQATMPALRQKSERLTQFLLTLVDDIPQAPFRVITPREPHRRGAQLSLQARGHGRDLFGRLQARGVVCDWREPDVIRVAPVPLYNSFSDVCEFAEILEESLA